MLFARSNGVRPVGFQGGITSMGMRLDGSLECYLGMLNLGCLRESEVQPPSRLQVGYAETGCCQSLSQLFL